MTSKTWIIIIGLISLFFGYIKYNQDLYYGNDNYLNEINVSNKDFKLINSELPLSHIIKLNEKFLICSGMNYPQIFLKQEYLLNNINNGGIYSYNLKSQKLEKLELDNYPTKLQFHPQGLSLYQIDSENYYLYVINHLIKTEPEKNVEKIEKFKLTISKDNISLYYKNSFSLPQDYFGTLNSIVAINEKILYFTTNNYFSLPCFSENENNYMKYWHLIKFKIYEWLNILFKKLTISQTSLYSYDFETDEINKIYKSNGISNRGLAYDPKNSLLYMVRSYEKDIKIFEVSKNIPSNALLIKTIKSLYNVENIYYDGENKKIYCGIYGSIKSLKELENSFIIEGNFGNISTFGGFEEINIEKEYEISDLIVFKNELKGITSAIKINDEIFFSSIYQNGLLIYKKTKDN
jgi:hypothetical protein